jgi:hypothetical protein
MSKKDLEEAKDRHKEVSELLERCKSMETDLAEIKERLSKVQRSVEAEVKRRKPKNNRPSGSSISGSSSPAMGLPKLSLRAGAHEFNTYSRCATFLQENPRHRGQRPELVTHFRASSRVG